MTLRTTQVCARVPFRRVIGSAGRLVSEQIKEFVSLASTLGIRRDVGSVHDRESGYALVAWQEGEKGWVLLRSLFMKAQSGFGSATLPAQINSSVHSRHSRDAKKPVRGQTFDWAAEI